MTEIILTDANFAVEVLQSRQPVLVDFFAPWCGPCKMQAPIIEAVAEELAGQVKVGALDVDGNPQTAGQYQVMSIPTIIIFKNGKPTQILSGLQNKDTLLTALKKAI